ncbi:uncharacterized protein [Henckelia pumila]|uniref:uncharacterized protein n=1 Tax=Henckelia pumila TaxID=405737 RepID=UPI003C6EA0D0
MNFVVGLPRMVRNLNSIWVIVDRLTKLAHFLPVRTTYPMAQYSKLYIRGIARVHGIPVSIVSDRDPRFTSSFWRSLHSALGTKLLFSTAFHPQMDGKSERGSWESRLPLVEFAYNNSYQATIGMEPYEALYGRPCRSPVLWTESRALAYRVALPPSLDVVHNIFHVSMLRKYIPNPSHVLSCEPLQLSPHITYEERPDQILDRQERRLRNKSIPMVKSSHSSGGGLWGDYDHDRCRERHHCHRDDHRRFSMNRFMQMGPKPLVGGETPEDAENWLERMDSFFQTYRCTEEQNMETLGYLLEGRARK